MAMDFLAAPSERMSPKNRPFIMIGRVQTMYGIMYSMLSSMLYPPPDMAIRGPPTAYIRGMTPKTATRVTMTDWVAMRSALGLSSAPRARAMAAEAPTPKARPNMVMILRMGDTMDMADSGSGPRPEHQRASM